jgi:hypothetical protein
MSNSRPAPYQFSPLVKNPINNPTERLNWIAKTIAPKDDGKISVFDRFRSGAANVIQNAASALPYGEIPPPLLRLTCLTTPSEIPNIEPPA